MTDVQGIEFPDTSLLKLHELKVYSQGYGKWSIIVDGKFKQQHWGRLYWPTVTEAEKRCEYRGDKVTIVYENAVGHAFICDIKY